MVRKYMYIRESGNWYTYVCPLILPGCIHVYPENTICTHKLTTPHYPSKRHLLIIGKVDCSSALMITPGAFVRRWFLSILAMEILSISILITVYSTVYIYSLIAL
jgi:hypothetical protein